MRWKMPFCQDDALKPSCDLQNENQMGFKFQQVVEPTHGLLLSVPGWPYNEGERDQGRRIDLVSE